MQNAQAGLDRENFHAVQRDELQNTQDELDGELFDVVFCAHAFHHVKDVKQLTLALSRRVKPGGCLLVIDHQMDHSLIEASSDPHMKEIDKVVAHKHGRSNGSLSTSCNERSVLIPLRPAGFKQQELEDLLRDSDQFESVKVEASLACHGRMTTWRALTIYNSSLLTQQPWLNLPRSVARIITQRACQPKL